jgi:tetratricopeptide (TPR) repeat protein
VRSLAFALFVAAALTSAPSEVPPLPAVVPAQFPELVRDRIDLAWRRAQEAPASAAATGELGMLLQAHDQLSLAEAAYARARALDRAAFEWPYLLGVVQLRLGRAADAVSALREAVSFRPQSLPARLRLGDALVASGEAAVARELYRRLVAESPDVAQVHYGLGRAAAALGDAAAAAESQRAATRLFPAYGAAHYALGLLDRDLGRTEEAREHLALYQKHWLEVPPLDDPVLARVDALNLGPDEVLAEGVRKAEAGDVAGAIRETERALEMDPALTRARANLIGLYARTGRWDKVEELYGAYAAASGRTEVDFNYGLALQQQDRRADAMAAFRRVLAASPLHAPAHNQLGLLLEAEGDIEGAASEYRQAVASQAAYRAARFNLGRVLVRQGRPRDAIPHFEQILEPDDGETPRYLFALGAAWARAGDRGKAVALLEDARNRARRQGQTDLAASIERDLGRLQPPP